MAAVSNHPTPSRYRRTAGGVPVSRMPVPYAIRLTLAAGMLTGGTTVMVWTSSGPGVDIGTALFVVGLAEGFLALSAWLGYLATRRAWWRRPPRHRRGSGR